MELLDTRSMCHVSFFSFPIECHQECEEALAEAMSPDPGGMVDDGGMSTTGYRDDLF